MTMRGAPRGDVAQRLLDRRLGAAVERAGRLVEDQDRRVLEQGAGDGDALLLAARKLEAALADHRRHSRRAGSAMKSWIAAPRAAASISAWVAPSLP